MATSTCSMPIEEYLRTIYRPDADFVDGEIVERNLGEFEHSTIQAGISAFFWNRRAEWEIQAVTAQRIRVSPRTVRIADVAILRANAPREKVSLTPPLICIEILSPEDRLSRAKLVLADYLAMGVPHIWLIDPIRRAAFTFDERGLLEVDPHNLAVPGTAIRLDLSEAFSAID
jgi:Uma2 family endonuclease